MRYDLAAPLELLIRPFSVIGGGRSLDMHKNEANLNETAMPRIETC